MKYHNILPSLIALSIFCSCEKQILIGDINEKSLIMNAMLSTADSVHTVFLSYGTIDNISAVKDGTVECYVNGGHVCTAHLEPQNRVWQAVHFKASIHPLDKVRLVACTSDGYRAEAVAEAPQRAVISSAAIDTLLMKLPYKKESLQYFHINAKVKDIENLNNWYRVQVRYNSCTTISVKGPYHSEHEVGSVVASKEDALKVINYLDPLLSNGVILDRYEDDLSSNTLNIFSDETFKNSNYDLSLLMDHKDLYAFPYGISLCKGDEFTCRSNLTVRLTSMNRDAYDYLRAVQYEKSPAPSTHIINHYPFSGNVEGGIGFVTVFSDFDYVITLPDKILIY